MISERVIDIYFTFLCIFHWIHGLFFNWLVYPWFLYHKYLFQTKKSSDTQSFHINRASLRIDLPRNNPDCQSKLSRWHPQLGAPRWRPVPRWTAPRLFLSWRAAAIPPNWFPRCTPARYTLLRLSATLAFLPEHAPHHHLACFGEVKLQTPVKIIRPNLFVVFLLSTETPSPLPRLINFGIRNHHINKLLLTSLIRSTL